jgi:hypothetical protein
VPTARLDPAHARPEDASDVEVAAAGKVSEAMEWIERARGHLFSLHQLIGRADLILDDAVALLREAGHEELADHVQDDVIGRNVLDGRWTFQIVEEFDVGYYAAARAADDLVRDRLMAGRRHVFEAEMKEQRRTAGRPGHEFRPPTAFDPDVAVHGEPI